LSDNAERTLKINPKKYWWTCFGDKMMRIEVKYLKSCGEGLGVKLTLIEAQVGSRKKQLSETTRIRLHVDAVDCFEKSAYL
jgi:hypothetical protein